MSSELSALPYSFFVNFNTQQSDIVADITRLNTICITKSNNILSDYITLYNADSITSYYSIDSEIKTWGDKFFSFQNKNGNYPNQLQLYNWYEENQPASLLGLKQTDINKLKVNGSFKVTINNQSKEISVDLTNALSYTDIATLIQEKIREQGNATTGTNNNTATETQADNTESTQETSESQTTNNNTDFSNASFLFNQVRNGFELRSGNKDSTNTLGYIEAGSSNIDLAPLLKMREEDGATLIQGKDKETFEEVITKLLSNNGNYYTITTSFLLDDTQIETLALLVSGSKNRFLAVVDIENKQLLNNETYTEKFQSYEGLIINYKVNEPLNALTCAFIASLDLTDNLVNMNFISASDYVLDVITTEEELNTLNKNRVNCIFAVGDFGERDVFYGEGNIMGDNFTKASTYIGNSFVKVNIEKNLFYQLANSYIIGSRNTADISLLRDVAINKCDSFVSSNIFASNVTLTDNETTALKNALNKLNSSKDIDTLYNAIIKNGYVFEFIRNTTSNNQIVSEFGMVYIANTPTDRIVINAIYI